MRSADFKLMVCAVLCALALTACSEEPDLVFEAPVEDADIVTLFGQVEIVNRAGIAPDVEPLFSNYGFTFEAAMGLSRESLLELDQQVVFADFPAGGAVREFSGPLLRDVIALADPAAGPVVVTALDGYQRTLDRDRIRQHDVILAISLDGDGLPIGGFGPAMLVWPRLDDPALSGMPDDDWIWGVFAIEIMGQP
ncbi:MAG: hypothetical protein CMF75_01720 [Maricaulis sp.]|nr:hypothetical protein [Maricaulis sp.]|tara:strand:- start:258 stop:842 length:585 start_codon:yes stop_codon:yes gene_type:complete